MRNARLSSSLAALALGLAAGSDVVGGFAAPRLSTGKVRPSPKFLGGYSRNVGNKAPSRRDRHRADVAARRAMSADKRRGCY